MSILKVFSIKDTKLGVYMQPFQLQHTGQALRTFEDIARDEKSTIYKHPSEYTLYQIATFDDETGEYKSEPLVSLACASDFKQTH